MQSQQGFQKTGMHLNYTRNRIISLAQLHESATINK